MLYNTHIIDVKKLENNLYSSRYCRADAAFVGKLSGERFSFDIGSLKPLISCLKHRTLTKTCYSTLLNREP